MSSQAVRPWTYTDVAALCLFLATLALPVAIAAYRWLEGVGNAWGVYGC